MSRLRRWHAAWASTATTFALRRPKRSKIRTPDWRSVLRLKMCVQRIELHPDQLIITIDRVTVAEMLASEPVDVSQTNINSIATIEMQHQMKRRGMEAKIIIGDSGSRTVGPDRGLEALIAKGNRWLEELTSGGVVSIIPASVGQTSGPQKLPIDEVGYWPISAPDLRLPTRPAPRNSRGMPESRASCQASDRCRPHRGLSGGPGRTRTCNQTVMSGRL